MRVEYRMRGKVSIGSGANSVLWCAVRVGERSESRRGSGTSRVNLNLYSPCCLMIAIYRYSFQILRISIHRRGNQKCCRVQHKQRAACGEGGRLVTALVANKQ